MKYIKSFSILFFTALALNANAQRDSIDKEVVVIQEYNPTITDAYKINSMPGEPEKPKVNKSFEYNVSGTSFTPKLQIYPLSSEPYTEAPRYAMYQNHISGGFGNYNSLYFDGFYNAYQSEEHQLDIFARHYSTFGSVKLENDEKAFAPFTNNKIGLAYQKQFSKSKLHADVFFNNRITRYYGYQTLVDSNLYAVDTMQMTGKDANRASRQVFNDINLLLNYQNIASDGEVSHNTSFALYNMTDHFSNSETGLKMGSELYFPLSENAAGLDAEVEFLFYNDPSDTLIHRSTPKNNIFRLALAPYYQIQKEGWQLKLGIKAFGVAEANNTFQVVPTPNIRIDLDLIPKFLSMYGELKGDYDVYSYKTMSNENPYIAPSTPAVAVQKPIDFEAGVRALLFPGLDIHVSGGYVEFVNQHFFVNELFTDTAGTEAFSNVFTTLRDNGTYTKLNAEVVYNASEKLQLGLLMDYRNYKVDTIGEAWHTPKMQLTAYGKYSVNEKIETEMVFRHRSSTQARISSSNLSRELVSANDLSLKGTYKYNEQLSGFVHLNNVLMQKYYVWNGYPSQRMNVLIGATYNF